MFCYEDPEHLGFYLPKSIRRAELSIVSSRMNRFLLSANGYRGCIPFANLGDS